MTWYAIRSAPGSQKPQREYAVEKTALTAKGNTRGKGYRIVPSLNPDVSAIERVLTDAGISCYMPAERRLIRDRLRPYLWKSRRFAMIVGYVFIQDPDWDALYDLPGVVGVVGVGEKPMPIEFFDILTLFDAEAKALVKFQEDSRAARQIIRKAAKTDPSLKKIVDKLDIAGTITIPLSEAKKAA